MQLEILDVEQNVVGEYGKKSTLEFEFTLESTEFKLDKKYEINLFTDGSGSNLKTFEFTDRTKKTVPAQQPNISTSPPPISFDSDNMKYNESALETEQELQQKRAVESHAEQKRLAEI